MLTSTRFFADAAAVKVGSRWAMALAMWKIDLPTELGALSYSYWYKPSPLLKSSTWAHIFKAHPYKVSLSVIAHLVVWSCLPTDAKNFASRTQTSSVNKPLTSSCIHSHQDKTKSKSVVLFGTQMFCSLLITPNRSKFALNVIVPSGWSGVDCRNLSFSSLKYTW